jgi:hypothetical protein
VFIDQQLRLRLIVLPEFPSRNSQTHRSLYFLIQSMFSKYYTYRAHVLIHRHHALITSVSLLSPKRIINAPSTEPHVSGPHKRQVSYLDQGPRTQTPALEPAVFVDLYCTLSDKSKSKSMDKDTSTASDPRAQYAVAVYNLLRSQSIVLHCTGSFHHLLGPETGVREPCINIWH